MDEAASHINEAILHGRTDIVKILLAEVKTTLKSSSDDENFDNFLNKIWDNGATFLHQATLENQRDIVRALLQEGANPSVICRIANDQTLDEENAFQAARRIDNKSTTSSGRGLCHVFEEMFFQATALSRLLTLRNLLDAGVSLSIIDTPMTRNTPLHWAASFSSSEDVFKLFVEYNVDVNIQNGDDAVALHDAVDQSNEIAINTLLSAGASMDIVATKGKFQGKSPKDLYKGLETNGHETEEKIDLNSLQLNSTITLADKNDIQIAQVHSSTSRESPISNISVEYSIDDTVTVEGLTQNDTTKEECENNSNPSNNAFISDKRSSPIPPLITDERLNLIWPQPKHVNQLAGDPCHFRKRLALTVAPGPVSIHEILDVWDSHRQFLSSVGRRVHICLNSPRHCAFNLNLQEPSFINGDCRNETTQVDEDESVIFCHVSDRLFPGKESYRLTISDDKIRIVASDLSGLHFAIVTLVQLFRLYHHQSKFHEEKSKSPIKVRQNNTNPDERQDSNQDIAEIIPVYISDYPDCASRAVLLDLNPYGRVPKKDLLFSMIDTWSMLKINQLHVFFRVDCRKSDTSFLPYNKSDILTLDRYCRDKFIELVPAIDVQSESLANQDEKDAAAIRLHLMNVFSLFDKPRFVHIGPILTAFIHGNKSFKPGGNTVPSNNMFDAHNVLPISSNETTVIVCANALGHSIPATVTLNTVMLQYGFQGTESFHNSLLPFAQAGCNLGVCSGTCSWSSFAGSPKTTLNNGYAAAKAAIRLGGSSCLSVTAHWSSHPALGHIVFAWPGFIIGAGQSWNCTTPKSFVDSVLNDLLDIHVLGEWKNTHSTMPSHIDISQRNDKISSNFSRHSVGMVLIELGKIENFINEKSYQRYSKTKYNDRNENSNKSAHSGNEFSVLLQLLMASHDFNLDMLEPDDLGIVIQNIKRAQSILNKCKSPNGVWSESYRHEIRLTSELMLIAARVGRAVINSRKRAPDTGTTTEEDKNLSTSEESKTRQDSECMSTQKLLERMDHLQPTFRTDIANKLLSLTEQFRALWLSRYESQGMQGSLLVLSNMIRMLIPSSPQNEEI